MNRFVICVLFVSLSPLVSFLGADEPQAKSTEKPATSDKDASRWKVMKDNWVSCEFGGDGPLKIGEDSIGIGIGDPLSGVRWTGEAPRENFEIELEARRTDGFDFFCGLTFPVGEKHVTFVLGGWGGGVVGISNIDGLDASENEQAFYRTFENQKWYKVRARVDPHQITCWIDDKSVIEQPRADHRFDVRFEMELCFPIGLAAYQSKVEYRNIRMRTLTPDDLVSAKKAADLRAAEDD